MERMQAQEEECRPGGAHEEGGRPNHAGHRRPYGHEPGERRGGARLTVYFLLCIICNFLLAIYALYALGLSVQLAADVAAAGQQATLAETAYRLLLLFSPLLLTVVLNRLLYAAIRGRHHRFPRWAAPMACLIILVVQAATVWMLFNLFGTGAAPGFAVDTITSLMP